MAGKTNFLEEAILNHIFRGTDIGANLANTYIGLFTVAPDDAGAGGTEAAYGGYARVTVQSVAGNWKDPSSATQGRVENLIKIVFPVNNGPNAETIVAAGVFDAVSGGNLLYWNTLTNFLVNRQDQPLFDLNQLIVAED